MLNFHHLLRSLNRVAVNPTPGYRGIALRYLRTRLLAFIVLYAFGVANAGEALAVMCSPLVSRVQLAFQEDRAGPSRLAHVMILEERENAE
jgi:hypothetical protein